MSEQQTDKPLLIGDLIAACQPDVSLQWLHRCTKSWSWKEKTGFEFKVCTQGPVNMLDERMAIILWLPRAKVLEMMKPPAAKGGSSE